MEKILNSKDLSKNDDLILNDLHSELQELQDVNDLWYAIYSNSGKWIAGSTS